VPEAGVLQDAGRGVEEQHDRRGPAGVRAAGGVPVQGGEGVGQARPVEQRDPQRRAQLGPRRRGRRAAPHHVAAHAAARPASVAKASNQSPAPGTVPW
jgi:hypothetical protein